MAETSSQSCQESQELPRISDITIRKIELSDADNLILSVTDDEVSSFCVWDTYTSRDEALDYIKNIVISHPWSKGICINDGAIGAISMTPIMGNDACRAELRYVRAYKYWGKGIVTRAVKMVVACIFGECLIWTGLKPQWMWIMWVLKKCLRKLDFKEKGSE